MPQQLKPPPHCPPSCACCVLQPGRSTRSSAPLWRRPPTSPRALPRAPGACGSRPPSSRRCRRRSRPAAASTFWSRRARPRCCCRTRSTCRCWRSASAHVSAAACCSRCLSASAAVPPPALPEAACSSPICCIRPRALRACSGGGRAGPQPAGGASVPGPEAGRVELQRLRQALGACGRALGRHRAVRRQPRRQRAWGMGRASRCACCGSAASAVPAPASCPQQRSHSQRLSDPLCTHPTLLLLATADVERHRAGRGGDRQVVQRLCLHHPRLLRPALSAHRALG